MIPKTEGDSTPLGQRPLCVLPAHIQDWFCSWVPDSVFSAGKGVSSVDAWYSPTIDIEEVLSNTRQGVFHIFVADVVKSFDTADRDILDCASGRHGLPAWFRGVYFSFHIRFKPASRLGVAWTRDGGIPQGCSLVYCCSLRSLVSTCRKPQRYLSSASCGQPEVQLLQC